MTMEISRETFRRKVIEAIEQGVAIEDIAGRLSCSKPTVRRWMNGTSSPTPTFRKLAVEVLDAILANRR